MATFILVPGGWQGEQWRGVPRKVFVGAHGWEGSPFLDLYERLRADPDWTTFGARPRR